MKRSLILFASVVSALLLGCDSQHDIPDAVPATGMVNVDGKPLATGTVLYEAVEGPGVGLAPASATITAGTYEIQAPVGKHKVRISSLRETGQVDATGAPIAEEVLPFKYNAETELTAEVAPGAPNAETFDLSSKVEKPKK